MPRGLSPVRTNLATARPLHGNAAEAWPESESRLERGDTRERPNRFLRWDENPLGDGTLLIHSDQGMGDEILFPSCFGDANSRTGHCVIECEPRLERLFPRSLPRARVWSASTVALPTGRPTGPPSPRGSQPGACPARSATGEAIRRHSAVICARIRRGRPPGGRDWVHSARDQRRGSHGPAVC